MLKAKNIHVLNIIYYLSSVHIKRNLSLNQFNIIILTHGEAGNALLASSEMIVGKTPHTTAISLMPGMSPEALMQQVKPYSILM